MKRLTKVSYLVVVGLFLLGTTDCSRAAGIKQQGKSTKKSTTSTQKQKQLGAKVIPSLPNGINVGGISIGITEFTRKKNMALVRLVFRCINEEWFPKGFSLHITDDRGNKYVSRWIWHYPFVAMPTAGSTWALDSPVVIRIPKIAPIAKFELIPDREDIPAKLWRTIPEKFNLDYRKLTPLPALNLKFRIKPEQILTGKEIKQDKHISLWFGEPKVVEGPAYTSWGDVDPSCKTISLRMPITIENRDYNPRPAVWRWQLKLQLNSGRILSGRGPRGWDRGTVEVEAVSKKTVEYSFAVGEVVGSGWETNLEKNEHVQLIWLEHPPPAIPVPGVWAVEGYDPSPKFWGFLYVSERTVILSEITLPSLPPRKLVPSHIEDGDWFPDGSKIVFSKQTYTEDTGGYGRKFLYRIFVVDPSGTNEKEIGLKQASSEIIDRIGYMDHVAPLVSPDGQKIAFVVTRGDYSPSIYIMDADGSNIRRISPGAYDSLAFAWISNDKIVFWEDSPYSYDDSDIVILYERGRIHILDINKGVIQKLKTPPPQLLEGKFVSGILGILVQDLQKIK